MSFKFKQFLSSSLYFFIITSLLYLVPHPPNFIHPHIFPLIVFQFFLSSFFSPHALSNSLFSSFSSSSYSFFFPKPHILFFQSIRKISYVKSVVLRSGPLSTNEVKIWPQMSRSNYGGRDLIATSPTTMEIKISLAFRCGQI